MLINCKKKRDKLPGSFVRFLMVIKPAILFLLIVNSDAKAFGVVSVNRLDREFAIRNIDVKGRVLDKDNKPLQGATVAVKGTQNSVVTNAEGYFEIKNVDAEAVLIVSFIGFVTQEVKVSSTGLKIRMESDAGMLEGVVVNVGYGQQSKAKVTGAISTVSGEQLRKRVTTNNTTGLAGLVPGLVSINPSGRPGSGSTISIRGQSSRDGNNASALFVIDGIIRSADDFAQLDPNEIEDLSVLQDAGSAAIYGVRATNGVILVTTRRGASGKPTVSLTTNLSFDQPTRRPKLLNAYQFAVLRNEADANMGATQTYSQEQIEAYRTGAIPSTDWMSVALNKKRAITQQHNINISGGSEAIRYFFGVGYNNQEGIYNNLGYKRYNFRSNVDFKVNENLSARVNMDGRVVNTTDPNVTDFALLQHSILLFPSDAPYYPSGRPVFQPIAGEMHPGEVTKHSGYNNVTDNLFNGTLSLTQKLPFITKGLSATGSINIRNQQIFRKSFNAQYPTYVESPDGEVTETKILGAKPVLRQQQVIEKSYTMNLSLDYNRKFGKHTVKGMVNYEQFEATINSFNGSQTNFPLGNLVDQLSAGGDDDERTIAGTAAADGRLAVISWLEYDYDAKYLFKTTMRNDASYRFAPGKRWGTFPTASLGWVISKESFFKKNVSFINFMKLRASYGLAGNDQFFGFQWKSIYNLGGRYFFSGNAAPLLTQSVVPNPNSTWEKTSQLNLGLDVELFNRQLRLTFDAFQKQTYDILAPRLSQYPGVYGANLPAQNYGKINVRGFEFAANYRKQINKELRYSVGGNVSFNRNWVKEIDYNPNAMPWDVPIGKPTSYTRGYKTMGLYQTDEEAALAPRFEGTSPKAGDIRYADLNNDGIIDARDYAIIDWNTGTPAIMYGFLLDASWKGFDLNIFLQGVANRTILLDGFTRNMMQNGNTFTYFMDRWTPDNPDASIPRAWRGVNPINSVTSDFWLRDANFLRVKNIQLAYSLPEKWMTKAKLSSVRLYVSGTNLFVFSKIKDFDPEFGGSGFYYPQNKTTVLGANITF